MPLTTDNITLRFSDCSGNFDVADLGDGRYQILDPAISLLADHFRCGDIVSATTDTNGELVIEKQLESSRFKTYGFLIPERCSKSPKMKTIQRSVHDNKGYLAVVFGGVFLIALPPNCKYDPTADVDAILAETNE